MKEQYPSIIDELFQNAITRIQKIIKIRKDAIEFFMRCKDATAERAESRVVAEDLDLWEDQTAALPKVLVQSSKNAVNLQKLDQIEETISETSSASEQCKSVSVSEGFSRQITKRMARAENKAAIERLEKKLDTVLELF